MNPVTSKNFLLIFLNFISTLMTKFMKNSNNSLECSHIIHSRLFLFSQVSRLMKPLSSLYYKNPTIQYSSLNRI